MMRRPAASRRLRQHVAPIVAKALIAGAALILSALTGCNLFYQSPFPGYVPLIQNQVDISDRFPYDPAAEYRMELVNGGEGDYIVVIAAGPELGERLAIYDGNLKERFYRKDSPAADEFDRDSPVIIDTTPNLYVGLLSFGPGLAGPGTIALNALDSTETLFEPGGNYLSFETDDTDTLDVESAANIDAAGGPIGLDVIGVGPSFQIVATTSSFADDIVGIVTFDGSSSTVYGTIESAAGFTVPFPLSTSPGFFFFPVEAFNIRELSITADGVIVEDEEDGPILRFYDLAGNEGESLSLREHESRYAFSATGKHFYLLRSEDEKLVKADTWW